MSQRLAAGATTLFCFIDETHGSAIRCMKSHPQGGTEVPETFPTGVKGDLPGFFRNRIDAGPKVAAKLADYTAIRPIKLSSPSPRRRAYAGGI